MKTNFTSARRFATLIAIVAILSITASAVQAQTFTGKPGVAQVPNSLRTLIAPAPNSSILRISYENDAYGTVHMLLRDERGTVLYDEQQAKRKYSGQLDLASLPAGVYTLVLQTPNARHTEYVHINTPASGQIVLRTSKSATEPVAERVTLNH